MEWGKSFILELSPLFNLGGKCTIILNFPTLHFSHSIGNIGKIILRRKENLAFFFNAQFFSSFLAPTMDLHIAV